MSPEPVPEDELDQLTKKIDEARIELVQVQEELADARTKTHRETSLLETNKELVAACLLAQGAADECHDKLKEASRLNAFDVLTELPNRSILIDRLKNAIAQAKRHQTRLAVLFLDLDDFKSLNDTMGHAVGDRALKQVAQYLQSSVRESDTVSRHGGDEFLILLAEVSDAEGALHVARKIVAELRGSSPPANDELQLAASIGVSVYPDHAEGAQALIDHADAAMYVAKRLQIGTFLHGQPMAPA